MRKKRIGIFGGTFNPIHMGHLRTAEEVREALDLDRVLFIPSFAPPFAKKDLAAFSHRTRMVRLAIRGNPAFSLSDIEAKTPGKSYSALTVKKLTSLHNDSRFYFLMGADAFMELAKWYDPEEIIRRAQVVVIMRPPFAFDRLAENPLLESGERKRVRSIETRKKISLMTTVGKRRIVFLRTTPLDISATYVRNQIKKGRSIKYLLPQRVESYIISNKLYY